MAEKTRTTLGMIVTIIGFVATIFAGGVGYGQLSSKVDTVDQSIKAHSANQLHTDEIKAKDEIEFAKAISALTANTETLQSAVEKLSDKIDRMK